MVYLIAFAKWPTDKTDELVKIAIEVAKKYPDDPSLGEILVPNAFKGGLDGMRSISISEVKEGKLKEAYSRARDIAVMYARQVAGFEYSVEVWSNVVEAYGSIGLTPPE